MKVALNTVIPNPNPIVSCFTGVHLGREKLLYIISQKYYWQGICHKVREFLGGCKECQDKVESQQMKKHYMEIVTNPEDYIGVETKVEETLDMNVEDESDLASVSFSDSWITSAQQSLDPCHFWDIVRKYNYIHCISHFYDNKQTLFLYKKQIFKIS